MNKLVCETIEIQSEDTVDSAYTGRTFLAGSDATIDEIITHATKHWGEWQSFIIHSDESVTKMVK